MLGNKISGAPDKDSFVCFFYPFAIKQECEDEFLKVGESKVGKTLGLDCWVNNKIMCSLEGGYASERSKKEDYSGSSKPWEPRWGTRWTGLAEGIDKPFTKGVPGLSVTAT